MTWNIFSCSYQPFVCFGEKPCLVLVFRLLLVLSCMSYLHVLKNSLLDISFANIFSHSGGYLFILLMVSLLCKSLVNVVPFVDVCFWCHVQKFTAKD